MIFNDEKIVTEFLPTFLKEDRSCLRKIHEIISNAESHICIIYPWITLGEEFVIPFENALSRNKDIELYLITKLEREDVFKRLHQLDDVEKWKNTFKDKIYIKYNNYIHAKMIIVDDKEIIVGSSNLTGSGLGSPRDYEGRPQIEANIYTNDRNAVENASNFFNEIWGHIYSKDYIDDEYVLSCKSYYLYGLFQRHKKDFDKILKEEGITVSHDGKMSLNGILAFMDNEKAYLLGNKRKEISIKIIGDNSNLKSFDIGDEVTTSGIIDRTEGKGEFTLVRSKIKENTQDMNIMNLSGGLSKIHISGEIIGIKDHIGVETKTGKKYLTLINIKDETGNMLLEIWGNGTIKEKVKPGTKIEIINGYTKSYHGELRIGLQKKDGKIILLRKR